MKPQAKQYAHVINQIPPNSVMKRDGRKHKGVLTLGVVSIIVEVETNGVNENYEISFTLICDGVKIMRKSMLARVD